MVRRERATTTTKRKVRRKPSYSSVTALAPPTKPPKATRTPTEIGQTVPTTARGEKAKAKALKAKSRRKAAREYSRTLEREAERTQRRAIRRATRANERVGRAAPPKATRLTTREAAEQWRANVKAGRETYSGEEDKPTPEEAVFQSIFGVNADDPSKTKLSDVAEAAASVAGPAAAFKVAKVARTLARGERGLDTTGKVAKTQHAAKEARTIRKAETATRKAKAPTKTKRAKETGKGLSKEAKARLGGVERKARRARRQDRAVRAATNPTATAITTSPTDVGKQVRENLEATFVPGKAANPIKTAATTLKAIPAVFAFGGTAAAAAGRAAVTGDTSSLEGVGKQGASAFKALEPLVSGNSEEIAEAMENKIGYPFAPLLPRGAVSAPARATGRAAAKGVKAAGKGAAKAGRKVRGSKPVTKVAPKKTPKTKPGPARRARQIVEGRPTRRRIAEIGGRTMGTAARETVMAQRRADKPAAKVGKKHGPEAESLAVVGIEHGLTRENPQAQLQRVLDSHGAHSDNPLIPNERKAIEWAMDHPEVFDDANLWKTIEEGKRLTEATLTSRSAAYTSQGRVAGVVPRHERVPAAAKELTAAKTRTEAWGSVEARRKRARHEKTEAVKARAAAKEAEGARRTRLRARAVEHRQRAQALEAEAKELAQILDPFTRPGHSLAGERIAFNREMGEEFVEDVKASRHPEAGEPGWVSNRADQDLLGDMGGPQVQSAGPRVVRPRSGEAGAKDIVDRSFAGFLADSVSRPRLQRGVNEFIRQSIKGFSKPIPGTKRRVIQSTAEANALIRDGVVDPREWVFVPVRHVKQAAKAEQFDLGGYHSEMMDSLNAEIDGLKDAPGTKYVLMRREPATEFTAQLNPDIGGLEGGLAQAGTVGSRLILGTNPAWLEAQFINEATQAGVAVNPARIMRARKTLHEYGKQNPLGRDHFRAMAGDSPAALESPSHTHKHMVTNHGDAFEAYRYRRKTPVGKMLTDLFHLRTFGRIDRAKTGEIRSSSLAGVIDREINSLPKQMKREVKHFFRGLAGMQELEYAISKELRGMTRVQQLDAMSTKPKLRKMFDKQLNYMDDVNGNWDAFTRFEQRFSPITMFYPYLRMSLRWSFGSYAKHHPVKAQILYQLAQSNREELRKLLGREPTFFESATPVVYGDEGEVSDVLPGGRRFGAPGSNAIVEAVGEENLNGLTRALNPIAQIGLGFTTGVDPYTGARAQFSGNLGEQLTQRGVEAARQLLSLPGPLRTGLGPLPEAGRIGKEASPATEKFDKYDPDRDFRSILFPFQPQKASDYRKQQQLSESFKATGTGIRSTAAQAYELIETVGEEEAIRRVKAQIRAKALQKRKIKYPESKQTPGEKKLFELLTILQYGKPDSSSAELFGGGSSSSDSGLFGGGSTAGSGGGLFRDRR